MAGEFCAGMRPVFGGFQRVRRDRRGGRVGGLVGRRGLGLRPHRPAGYIRVRISRCLRHGHVVRYKGAPICM